MNGSIRFVRVFGIDIRLHWSFIFLPLIFGMFYGIKGIVLVGIVFFLVSLHELSHSLCAKKYGIAVESITLLPIGGLASMKGVPSTPRQELLISLAGPGLNFVLALIFFVPFVALVGKDGMFLMGFENWRTLVAYAYWINIMLGVFNLLPAFPMDGGRVLRSLLAIKLDYKAATEIAVTFGHAFAFVFILVGLFSRPINIILIVIGIFIYAAASQEALFVDLRTTLHRFRVKDLLSGNFYVVEPHTTLSDIVELIFKTHQEDFPVVESSQLVGFITRKDVMAAMQRSDMSVPARQIMRTDFPAVEAGDSLEKVYALLQESMYKALPVMDKGVLKGIITVEDVARIYYFLKK